MKQSKKFASISGLHKIFQTYNSSTGNIEGYLPNLLPELPQDSNGNTIDKYSILFIIADSTDVGRYVYPGVKAVEGGSKESYGGSFNRSYIHERDTFIWAQGVIITGADCGIQAIGGGEGDRWISVDVDQTEAGDVTIDVTHKVASHSESDITNEASNSSAEVSGGTVNVITSITIDAAGHVTGVTTGKATDTTYKIGNNSVSNELGTTTTRKDQVVLTPIVSGVEQTPLPAVTIDEVEHLRYTTTGGASVTVGVTNSTSNASDKIMTAKAVQSAITAAVEAGVSFKGVSKLSDVLNLTSGDKGEMWKLNNIDVVRDQYKNYIEQLEDNVQLKIGDVLVAKEKFTSKGVKWYYIPSGDDIEDSWRAITVNGEDFLASVVAKGTNGNANDGMAVNLKSGNLISVSVADGQISGDVTFSHLAPFKSTPVTSAPEGTFINGIIIDSYGHIVGINTASLSDAVKDNINSIDLTSAANQAQATVNNQIKGVSVGVKATKNDGSSIAGDDVELYGTDGVKLSTDSSGSVVIKGTTYSISNVTSEDTEATSSDPSTKSTLKMVLTGTGAEAGSTSSQFAIKSPDASLKVTSNSGIVEIDYTGVSTKDDWFII